MTRELRHRGSDDSGIWTANNVAVGLGHQRLSILDLSTRGHQPMSSSCGRYVITFNGEIYNYPALRSSLEAIGRTRFRSSSDTEVLLEAISEYGVREALRASNGMFAIAVWDLELQELTLARDRLGEKPLYYGRIGNDFAFASELIAIRRLPGFSSEINRGVLSSFLQFGYVPTPFSIFQGIFQVPPGNHVTVDLNGQAGPPAAFWSLEEAVETGLSHQWTGTDDEAVDHLDFLLRDSIRMRMQADVPLGVFLSGGVDSSTVAAEMRALGRSPVLTFTIGFQESGYDETIHARRVADHLGTDHTSVYVTAADAAQVVPRLATMYSEPFADVSQIPTFLISALARADVKVALSGDGGDEMFGGYTRYAAFAAATKWLDPIPWSVRRTVAAILSHMSPDHWSRFLLPLSSYMRDARSRNNPEARLEQVISMLRSRDISDSYATMVTRWPQRCRLAYGTRRVSTRFDATSPQHLDPYSYGMYVDAVSYLPDDILTKVDRASMAVGLECRLPLLDHRILEFAWSLPTALKYRDGDGKWILRQVLERYVPPALYDRPKMGFGVPIGAWLRSSLRCWAQDLLDPVRLRAQGYLDPSVVLEAWNQIRSGSDIGEHRLWTILMFQAWLEEQ